MLKYFSLLCLMIWVGLSGQVYSLPECVEIALVNKSSLKSAALEVQTASSAVRGSLSNFLPSVSYSNSWNETHLPEGQTTSSFEFMDTTLYLSSPYGGISNAFGISFSLSQPIYDGGRWMNQIRTAKNNLLTAQQLARQQKISVILNVHQSFFQLLRAQQLYEVARKNLDLAREQVNLANTQFDLGVVKKTDLLKTQVLLGRAQADILINETNVKNAMLNLKNSMGLAGSEAFFEVTDPGKPLMSVPGYDAAWEELEQYNPALIVSKTNVAGAELNRKIIVGSRLPNISASFSYGNSGNEISSITQTADWNSSVNLSLSIPLFTGFNISSRQQQAEYSVRKLQFDYITQKQELQSQLESLINNLVNYQELISINEQVLKSAEEDLKLVQQRYQLGSATILEVLDAQVSVSQARSTLVTTKYDARIQEAQLRSMLGTLDQDYK